MVNYGQDCEDFYSAFLKKSQGLNQISNNWLWKHGNES